jgi:hypothetical protein
MGDRTVTFRKADVARAITAVAAKGLEVGAVEITRGGTIRILTAGALSPVDEEEAELAAYRAKRNGQG